MIFSHQVLEKDPNVIKLIPKSKYLGDRREKNQEKLDIAGNVISEVRQATPGRPFVREAGEFKHRPVGLDSAKSDFDLERILLGLHKTKMGWINTNSDRK
jgi:hypothetical protein